jgi:hypothetical protein
MTRYPTIDEYWPARRARNFVKAGWGGSFPKYAKNMQWLSMLAGVPVEQMCYVNPVTFAERNGLLAESLLGKSTYEYLITLRMEQQSIFDELGVTPPAKLGANPVAIGDVTPPAKLEVGTKTYGNEYHVLNSLIEEFHCTESFSDKLLVLSRLFKYLQFIPNFLRKNPAFYEVAAAKVAEFKDDPVAISIRETIMETEAFMATL